MEPQKTSILTCPECGSKTEETMSFDACQYFWECPDCKNLIKPLIGDCCVFCSYGSSPCPPIQQNNRSSCCE